MEMSRERRDAGIAAEEGVPTGLSLDTRLLGAAAMGMPGVLCWLLLLLAAGSAQVAEQQVGVETAKAAASGAEALRFGLTPTTCHAPWSGCCCCCCCFHALTNCRSCCGCSAALLLLACWCAGAATCSAQAGLLLEAP